MEVDGSPTVRIAAAGDVHASSDHADELLRALDALDEPVDLLLLAGDLTTHGQPEQGHRMAEALRDAPAPVFAVLGNHDHHCGQVAELVAAVSEAGVTVLDREATTVRVGTCEVGIVGVKGGVGGFPGSHLPDFGEASLRAVYREVGEEVDALRAGLQEVATSSLRIALLHYAPTVGTLHGEPTGIWAFLGTDRLAAPILEHEPDLVLHGHAHAGSPDATIGTVPVHNVSLPVTGGTFRVFELAARRGAPSGVH